MKIFEKRPLAIILCIMLGAFSFFADCTWETKLMLAAVPLVIIVQIFIFDKIKFCRNTIIILSLVALTVSLSLASLWTALFYPQEYYGKDASFTARIYEIDDTDYYSTKIVCKSTKIDGKRDKHTFIAYVNKADAVRLKQYDVITFNAEVSDFTNDDDGFDGRSYYVSRGYSALLDDLSDITVLGNKPDKIDAFFKSLKLSISNKLKLRTDYKTGSFLCALIVGNRDDLDGNTKLDFKRLGISHILALSGMHLAILSAALNFALVRMSVKKKQRVIITSILVLLYMALTGFSASVVRSGLMLIISGVLYLLSSKSDHITSLSVAVFLIVLFNPTSVYDLSLWLSAFATLGVVVFSEIAEKIDSDTGFFKKLWILFKNGCLVSVFAFCATFALTALRFDGFSVISVITTLVFSVLIQFFIYGGLLVLLIGGIIPIGKLLVFFSNIILWMAESISSVKYVYVSIDFLIVKLLIVLLSVFFFSFLIFEVKNRKRIIIMIVIMLGLIFTTAEACTLVNANRDDAIYTPSAAGDTVLLKSDSEVSVIYSGRAVSKNGRDILNILIENKLTYVDSLVFASYSHSTIEFATVIIDGIKVEKIMLPIPTTDEELGQAEGLSYLLAGYGTYLEFYEPLKYVELGDYEYCLFDKCDYTYGKSPENAFQIKCGDSRFAYVSACEYELLSPSAKALIYQSESLIIGTSSNKNEYIFEIISPNIEDIYFHEDWRISDGAKDYYNKKGASTNLVKTPLSFIN